MSDLLAEIAASTAQTVGDEYLAALVRAMREAMAAKLVLLTTGIGEPPVKARTLVSWQKDGPREAFEYDLDGLPCRLVYNGETLVVSEGLCRRFPREAGYEGYIGVPLCNAGRVIGHLAVLSDHPLARPDEALAIARLFSLRAEAELQRIAHEREREALIDKLTRTNRRLASQHAELRRANEAKTLLLGMAAHDLRNPLAAILNRSEFISALFDRPDVSRMADKAKESCELIAEAAGRMDRLIASSLTRARSEATAISIAPQEFNLRATVAVAVAYNAEAAKAKAITLADEVDAEITVIADEDRIVEALDNLIRNAIKYSPPATEVKISAETAPGFCMIRVTDQGQGLSQEDCARAFRMFQRLSARTEDGESSTGLGLAIVKAIAEAHGGTASVESEGKGKGATFSISLPRKLV